MVRYYLLSILCGLTLGLFSQTSQGFQPNTQDQGVSQKQAPDQALCSQFDTFTSESAASILENFKQVLSSSDSDRDYVGSYQLANGEIVITDTRTQTLYPFYQKCLKSALDKNILAFISDEKIIDIFHMIDYSYNITGQKEIIAGLKMIIDFEIENNRINRDHILKFYELLISSRQFDKATRFAKLHNLVDEEKVPEIVKINHAGRKVYKAEDNHLVETAFDFPKGGHIVIVSSAYCGPSRRLRNWLDNHPDKAFVDMITRNTTWISSSYISYSLNQLIEYNEDIGPGKIHIVEKKTDWPEIKSWGTPEVYFYEDGVLMAHLVGWPHEGREQELKKKLEYITLN